jgi:hypothetical protein
MHDESEESPRFGSTVVLVFYTKTNTDTFWRCPLTSAYYNSCQRWHRLSLPESKKWLVSADDFDLHSEGAPFNSRPENRYTTEDFRGFLGLRSE